jgi:DnaJ family protein C protein 7
LCLQIYWFINSNIDQAPLRTCSIGVMAETAKHRVDGEIGCGFMGGIFQRRSYWPRKTSVHSLPADSSNDISKRERSSSGESVSNLSNPPPKLRQHPARNSTSVHPRPSNSQRRVKGQRPSDAARSSTSSSATSSGQIKEPESLDSGDERKPNREPARKCTELSRMPIDSQQFSESKVLVRATSSNVMLLGHLGNLRQTGKISMPIPRNGFGKISGNANMGNIVRKNSDKFRQFQGVGNKLDNPEAFKCMGNEAFKQGRYDEALALYDRAIALDSNKSSYHSNKSAALIGLGRLVEAIIECREAIRIEPSYHRAHHRLAKLYLRYSINGGGDIKHCIYAL